MSNLHRFFGIYAGETCVIIGNGPSLKLQDLELLGKKYMTFGSNKIYRLPYTPDFYSIVDKEMLETCLPLPEDFKPKEMFLRAEACVKGNNPIYPIVASGASLDITNFVVMGGTVTFVLLQIAFYMGFTKALLIGVDHNYPLAGKGNPGEPFIAGKTDPDHFKTADGKPYFDEGKTFNRPEIEGTTRAYGIAKQMWEQIGRKIINITPNSKLDVYEKDKLENWI